MSNTQVIITVPEGKVRDYIDGTLRKDTPEEYVRQNVQKRLINEHKYPKSLVKVEFSIKMGSSKKRVDLAIFPENCHDFNQENIYILIECKSEKIQITDKKEGVDQLKSYMYACGNCEWGMWTNGKEREVYRKEIDAKGKIHLVEFIDIPSFHHDVADIDRPKRDTQKTAVEDNLLFVFKKCHNHIHANEGMQKQPAFFELLKIIFCKIEDEKNITQDIQFYVTSKERLNPDGQLTSKKRINKIFASVKEKYKAIFESNQEIELSARTVANIVSELQKYSLLDTNIDVKGKAYEEIVGANLRGDRGEFFTPRNVMKMAVAMINPKEGERILDSSCGTGGFLVTAMNHVIKQIEATAVKNFGKPKNRWTDRQKEAVRDKISEVARNYFFGFDINPDLVKATKMNMVMNNDGSGNILRENSLLQPHEWSADFKYQLSKAVNIPEDTLISHKNIGLFDVIITNPPFGSKLPVTDINTLRQFDIAGTSKSVPPEQLFVERCVQFLKPGGRMAIVLPDSILGAPGLIHIRKWLLKHTRIIASIDLHVDTFQPRNGTQTSVLIVQKKNEDELRVVDEFNYSVFMAMIEKVGHDKRGNNVYKRDHNGEILYFQKRKELADGDVEITMEPELDDQTELIEPIFTKWKNQEGIGW